MRALKAVLLALCVACGPDDEGEPPVCSKHPLAAEDCRDNGQVLPDGTVTGFYCAAGGPDDGSWPKGCERLRGQVNIETVTMCCPW